MDPTEKLLAEVDELVWALLDDRVSDGQLAKLERLLLASEPARERYIQCMQMHADLHSLFREEVQQGSSNPAAPVTSVAPAMGLPGLPTDLPS